jgi:hypothetical protein
MRAMPSGLSVGLSISIQARMPASISSTFKGWALVIKGSKENAA